MSETNTGFDELRLENAAAVARRQRRLQSSDQALWAVLDGVLDPELPALSIWELGILQDIRRVEDLVTVVLTPTYAGCPAMATIRDDVIDALEGAGFGEVRVEIQLQPVWTTDWLDRAARDKLQQAGIAPPVPVTHCPQCGSDDVSRISEFGATACKALYRCTECFEVFDRFKMF